MSEIDILCVGHASYDITAYVSGYPPENGKFETDRVLESGGGPAANAAYLLSKWGCRCALAALIGKDDYARRIITEFEALGTDLSLLFRSDDTVTPLSLIIVNTLNGSRTIVNRKSCEAALDLDGSSLAEMNPKVILFDGHELQASLQASKAFPNAISILDAGSLRPGTQRLAEIVNYLVSSERFALQMTGLPDLNDDEKRSDCLNRLKKIARGEVVVTLGDRGLIYDCGNGTKYLPAYPAKTVDTTAAGDIFHGAFAYGVLQGRSLEDTLKIASMAASLSVQTAGGRPSIPTLEETMG